MKTLATMDFLERKLMEVGAKSFGLVDPSPDPQAAEANDVERSDHDQHGYLQGQRFWLATIGYVSSASDPAVSLHL